MLSSNSENSTKPHFLFSIGVTLIVIILFQSLHFVFYYRQPISLSIVWSFVDWIVWFTIAIGFYYYCLQKRKFLTVNCGFVFVLLAGPCQILIASIIYLLIFNSEQSLIDAFLHMMNKRWLQNLFFALAFVLLILFQLSPQNLFTSNINTIEKESRWKPEFAKTSFEEVIANLVVKDGAVTHKIVINDIFCVCAARNYLSIFVPSQEIVIRSSLSAIKKDLSSSIFVQISRSKLINKNRIVRLEKYSKTSHRIILQDGSKHNIGRTFSKLITQQLNLG